MNQFISRSRAAAMLALSLFAACAPARRGPVDDLPVVHRPAPVNPTLPPMPHVRGPLAINVVYPKAGTLIASRDSNFIFGSVGNGDAFLTINGVPSPVWPNGAFMAYLRVPAQDDPTYELVARVAGEEARLAHPVRLPPPAAPAPSAQAGALPESAPVPPLAVEPRFGVILGPDAIKSDTDRVAWATPTPAPTEFTRYFLLPGTVVEVLDSAAGSYRIGLDAGQRVTISALRLRREEPGFTPPRRVAGDFAVALGTEWSEFSVPIESAPAYLVEQPRGDRELVVTLFGTTAAMVVPPQTWRAITDPYLTSVTATFANDRATYRFALARPVFGYLVRYEGGRLIVAIRRPPQIDPQQPLRGLLIAVDPGHPPAGATGPTSLYEGDATVPVGLRVKTLLEERGARVFMTKTTPDTLELDIRPTMARRANAHALVSIHYNALPDGVNPFVNNGTSTYYYHPHSRRLAEFTNWTMLKNMYLNDLGVRRDNFALVRSPFAPAILTEGAFIMMPDQEAAIRTAEFQDAYARSIVEGLEAYFAELARR